MAEREGFSIQDFKSQISTKGLKKTNKFLARFYLPIGMQDYVIYNQSNPTKNTQRFLEYWIESTQIPSIAFQSHEHRRYGYGSTEKVPFIPTFSEIPFTILMDSNNDNWKFFYHWSRLVIESDGHKLINPRLSNFGGSNRKRLYELSYKEDYVSTVEIKSFDDKGDKYLNIYLRDAFPLVLSEIDLNWNEVDTIQKFKVVMSFTDFYLEDYKANNPI